MAIPRRMKLDHADVFPLGAYLVGEVSPVWDFEKSTKDVKVQQPDKDTGLPLWSVDVVDADPEAQKKSKTLTVKIPAKVQPVPPKALPGLPFRPVAFENLTALAYIEESGSFSRVAWSLRADAMIEAKYGTAAKESA